MKILFSISLIILIASGLFYSRSELRQAQLQSEERDYQPLYLPESKYIKLVSGGFDNFAADLLWFKTINYFGSQYQKGKDYRWLAHMCELVTNLNPRATEQFEFCATLLSWMAKDPHASNKLLDLAIANHPKVWRFRYLRGFNHWYFLEDNESAREDLIKAAKLPDAPSFLSSLASRLIANTADPKAAIDFLERQLAGTKDKVIKEALEDKLKRAILSWHLDELKNAARRYYTTKKKQANSFQEIIDAGFLKKVPEEPFSGSYQLKNGVVTSTSGEKSLEFFGKTAKTGVFREEFKNTR